MVTRRLLIVGCMSLTACSAAKFGSSKNDLLSKTSVFGDYTGHINQPGAEGNGISDSRGQVQQPGGGDNAAGNIRQPEENCTANCPSTGRVNQPDGTNDEVDFLLTCSDSRSEDAANFKRAIAENLPVQLLIGNKVCTSDINVIKGVIVKKSFTIADAQKICPPLAPESGTWSNVSLVVDGKAYSSIKGTINVLYALNNDEEPAEQAADELCDRRSSPLVIHVNSDPGNPRPVNLSSQDHGVLFDLLGERANHELVRISWFTNGDYGILTLPDANGRVRGIDELFGNSTVGPDGLFADNGYAALAKFDGTTADGWFQSGTPDGVIDARDPVYEHLRVWMDRNRDGLAQARELAKLPDAGITFIDLRYSSDFAETDRFGNQTLMKSVVGRADNSLDLIFDVWFAYRVGGR